MFSFSSCTITCFAFRSLKLFKFLPVNGVKYRSNYVIFQWLSIFPPPLSQQPIIVPVTRDAAFIIYYVFIGIWVYFKTLNIFHKKKNRLFCLFIHKYHLIQLLCLNNELKFLVGLNLLIVFLSQCFLIYFCMSLFHI